ncbi:serine/threonine-protein kinase [Streptomyces sp. NPDC006645]|uniref:serine/threonine-protein kinase n=1 Tax=unclassified Streptomyces TaxID=2593676 RepID=UPI00339FE8F6
MVGQHDQGGHGRIWKAIDLTTGAQVAVKMVRLDRLAESHLNPAERARLRGEMLKRFEREGAILADLDHPAIPRLLHRGYHGEVPYLVMEYVDGVNLRDFLDRHRPLPLDAACAIAVQIGQALAHAHVRGVVHRDLKPNNLVMTAEGTVKLVDFGIAHLTDPDATRYTPLGDATPGSVGYMAPEQLENRRDITAKADYYALGCVLFELVTGEQPFTDKPGRNRATQHIHDLPPRIRDINAGLPQKLDDLVWDLLAKSATDRPVGTDDILPTLGELLPGEGDPAPEPELVPDPTLRYRMPGGMNAEGYVRPVSRPSRRPVRRRGAWSGRTEFAALLLRARAELEGDGPGPESLKLDNALHRAVSDWGLREATVSDAQLACADRARLEGRIDRARPLYERVAVALAGHEDPDFLALALEARVGIAECAVADGEMDGAVTGWVEAVGEVLRLPSAPSRLVARCREVALELDETGFGEIVAPVAARLPRD